MDIELRRHRTRHRSRRANANVRRGRCAPRERELFGGRDVRDAADRRTAAEPVIEELREEAKAHDVFAPQLPEEYGGTGSGIR
ncbi:MAG: hypothetical protein U5K37_10695 [Natrialbaceae archaeon]|nr:hypothetical protein [Natrialbaceae archaeon]